MADGRDEAAVDYDLLQPVGNRVIRGVAERGFLSLDDADQVFYLLWCYGGAVSIGGHASFFFNNGADYYAETVDALNRAGLPVFSRLLVEAAAVFFAGDVPRGINQRNAVMRDGDVSKIDVAFFDADGGDAVLRALERWQETK
ncbi:MAG: DUF4375 domain-containing protein [Acidobacteria bacterium]|nr:DUF4375 domain-containing protein [Acidobacteriota bacterium]